MKGTKLLKSEDAPVYEVDSVQDDDAIIARAIEILKARLKPGLAMTGPDVVKNYLLLTENTDHVEQFRAVWLDAAHQVIAVEVLSTGTLTQASVYTREVVRSALKHNAAAVIVSHNHPSGNTEASNADLALTKHLKEALSLVDVRLLDHIITSSGEAMSFAERGMI